MTKKYSKYTIKGTEVPGVTTILKVISKPGLEAWYGRLGIKEAERQRDAAASFGSLIHDIIEDIYGRNKKPLLPDSRVKSTINNFKKWSDKYIEEWITFEKAVFHDELMYAGTVDAFARLKGSNKLVLVDIKTSKSIRAEYFLQVSAYANATRLEDDSVNLRDVEGAIIVHLDHATLEWKAVNVELDPKLFSVFKAAVEIYKWQKNG